MILRDSNSGLGLHLCVSFCGLGFISVEVQKQQDKGPGANHDSNLGCC